ncbi:MAG: glutamate--tRNA ligase [Oscillospiraceae bacterium]|nr:glutamate--tRNA ligase [Oscillospiraceae bacterium]
MNKQWFNNQEAKIPRGKVRTRFAPSPTGYMHVGGLRTALYAYLIAKKDNGTFILRIEDTDKARFVEGATEIIIKTLRDAGLNYDEGPDIGGPVAPYTQSERLDIYKQYAALLCEKGAAYYCFCERQGDERQGDGSSVLLHQWSKIDGPSPRDPDPCRDLPYAESKIRADAGVPFVVRMKAPYDGNTTVADMVFGEITTPNKTLDDMILLKRDGYPTYNFANVIDDHLMGITHVMRGSEYLSSAPKYNLLYKAFGWEIPTYITVSPVMRDANNKLSKRHGDPTYDDLLTQGYLPEAVLNYVALLGWSPGGEREMFTLKDMLEVFDVSGISKAPAIFDMVKLTHFNSEYIRAMPAKEFAKIARPYICNVIKNENISIEAVATILQARCEKLTDIPEKIDFFESLPNYDTELYIHKKSKTDKMISRDMLIAAKKAFEKNTEWTNESIHDILIELALNLEVKNATLMWPVRIATAGKAVTPGGAIEICSILGYNETLRRIEIGIEKLSEENR